MNNEFRGDLDLEVQLEKSKETNFNKVKENPNLFYFYIIAKINSYNVFFSFMNQFII